MNLLLDTHVILWWLMKAPDLTPRGYELIADQYNICFVSAASIWEIKIKEGIGKLTLPDNFQVILENESFESLSVSARHAHQIGSLPLIHRDPFDRILIAQAKIEGLTLVSKDSIISEYQVEHILL